MSKIIMFISILFISTTGYCDSIESKFPKSEIGRIEDAFHRNGLTDENLQKIVYAIRIAEGRRVDKFHFGIKHPKCPPESFDSQAGWAVCTVRNNWERFGGNNYDEFIKFLGTKYAPIGADNDPNNLNTNWVKNVTHWFNKFK